MKTLRVTFVNTGWSGGKQYDYLYNGPLEVKPGDYAVTKTSTSSYPQIVEVCEVIDGPTDKATKHVVQIVDLTEWEREQEKQKRRNQIIKRLKQLEKEMHEKNRFELVAQGNPEAAELLKELDQI